jgi:HEPN domain-containing protein
VYNITEVFAYMPRKRVTLLDRAKADLAIAELALKSGGDVIIDVAAYHCQQCVEKTVKFLIQLQGDTFAPSHETDSYLEDLNDRAVKERVRRIAFTIDAWGNQILYHHSIISSKRAVTEVLDICRELIDAAEAGCPDVIE